VSLSLAGFGRLPRPATGSEKGLRMDYGLASIVSILLFAYLMYALLKPERF
jgi:K+-transporting ATPase KdpF subunit